MELSREEGLWLLHNGCDKAFLIPLRKGLLGLLQGPLGGEQVVESSSRASSLSPHHWAGVLDGFNLLQDPPHQ